MIEPERGEAEGYRGRVACFDMRIRAGTASGFDERVEGGIALQKNPAQLGARIFRRQEGPLGIGPVGHAFLNGFSIHGKFLRLIRKPRVFNHGFDHILTVGTDPGAETNDLVAKEEPRFPGLQNAFGRFEDHSGKSISVQANAADEVASAGLARRRAAGSSWGPLKAFHRDAGQPVGIDEIEIPAAVALNVRRVEKKNAVGLIPTLDVFGPDRLEGQGPVRTHAKRSQSFPCAMVCHVHIREALKSHTSRDRLQLRIGINRLDFGNADWICRHHGHQSQLLQIPSRFILQPLLDQAPQSGGLIGIRHWQELGLGHEKIRHIAVALIARVPVGSSEEMGDRLPANHEGVHGALHEPEDIFTILGGNFPRRAFQHGANFGETIDQKETVSRAVRNASVLNKGAVFVEAIRFIRHDLLRILGLRIANHEVQGFRGEITHHIQNFIVLL